MKKTLLAIISFVTVSAFAQTVNNFYVLDGANAAGVPYIITSGTANESTTGANVTWDFSGLTADGSATTTTMAPTTTQSTTYPGTTLLAQSEGEYNGAGTSVSLNVFTNGSGVITGINLNNMVLNYSTNNATLGTFPLQYGYTNTDAVAGTFSAMGYNGTFTGTCVTSVDGYGTITTTLGSVAGNTVTRLKVVQTLSLIYLGLPVGTVNQTFYLYYQSGVTYPLARSINFAASVPALGYNYSLVGTELYGTTAGTDQVTKNTLAVYPNPATDVLHFSNDVLLTTVTITDAAGRIVLSGAGNDLNVSGLTAGVYYATAQAAGGKQAVKFIKR